MKFIEYTGEFGSEVGTFVPFVNYLKKSGQLINPGIKIRTYTGMKPYYFFLDDNDIEFKDERRTWIHPMGRVFLPPNLRSDDDLFAMKHSQPINMFDPPLFYTHYKKYPELFPGEKLLLIQNKYNSEWGGLPVNYIDVPLLELLLKKIRKEFKIIYIRTNDFTLKEYSSDDNEYMSYKLDDKELIKAINNGDRVDFERSIILIEELYQQTNKQYDFNTLKCILHSQATATISTIGGFNFFTAYFPCQHIIYKVDTPPIYGKEFYQNQHDMLTSPSQYSTQQLDTPVLHKHLNTHDIIFVTDKQELVDVASKL